MPNPVMWFAFLLSVSIIMQFYHSSFRIITYGIEFAIFILSTASLRTVLLDQGNYSLWAISGVIVGYASFIISVVITKTSLKEGLKALIGSKQILTFMLRQHRLLAMLLVSAAFEEYIWRGIIQVNIKPAEIGIIITAILFSARHNKALNGDCLRIADFFLFSLILGISYWLWHSYVFIVTVHFVRNIGVLYYYMSNLREESF